MTECDDRKRRVRAAFDRAAPTYDGAAAVQREICGRLMQLLEACPPQRPPERVLDAGCGTGTGARSAHARLGARQTVALDFAPAMLACHPTGDGVLRLCGDLEALPLADGAVDAVWSSLAIQWCNPARALAELGRVTRPGGVAWIATLGPHTLWELREAFRPIDDAAHVIGFHGPDTWRQAAMQAGFRVTALVREPAWATAPTLRMLLRDIKAIGAHQVGSGRRRAPLGKAAWRQLERTYDKHRRADGLLPATYDVIALALHKETR